MLDVLDGHLRAGARAQLHLRAVMADVEEHAWRRANTRRTFRTANDWQQHIRRTRAAFRTALGPLPERTPLGVECTGVLERNGYVVEKLIAETQPAFFVTANLYRPASQSARAPGIVSPVGHWQHSKAQEAEQARLIGLARKGYVALIWDPVGQGERSQYWDSEKDAPPIPLGTSQHAAVCNPAMLIGSTVIAAMVWDGSRMIDYLVSRPEVDPERIGCTGVSGGGTHTMFLGAFDERIKATVPVCSTSRYERMYSRGLIGDPCQNPIRSFPNDLDMADLLLSHAPAALRIIGSRYDFFPLMGLREAALDVQDGYAGLGIPQKTDLCVVDAHHDYNKEQREQMYAWFNRWLDHDAPVEEAPYTPEEPRTLWSTSTGQLITSVGGKTVPDLVRDLAHRLIPEPAPKQPKQPKQEAKREQQRILTAIREVLGPIPALDGAPPVERSPVLVDRLTVERLVLQARMDVLLPTLVFRSELPPNAPTVILIDDRGNVAESSQGGLARLLAGTGILTLAVDLRGWGETAWGEDLWGWSRNRRDLMSADNMLSYVGYMLGHWSVTQRVQDLLGVLAYTRSRPDVNRRRIFLVGVGGGAIVALHAAAIDGNVRGVATCDALATYRSIVEAKHYAHPVADFLPSVLAHYDLPHLAAALAPARVLAINPQNAMGEPLAAPAAAAAFGSARALAGVLGGEVREETGCSNEARAQSISSWIAEAASPPQSAVTA